MNSIHDLGGVPGFGPVEPETDEPVFHAPWEGRVMALYRAMGFLQLWSIDSGRAMIESLPPRTYLTASYYAKWLMGLERSLERVGVVGADEIEAGRSLRTAQNNLCVMTATDVANIRRGNFERPAPAPARFRPGDRVRTLNLNSSSHTRLPRYACEKKGVIEAVRGCHVFPDTAAIGAGENPQWLYSVVFSGPELWGADADPTLSVSIEAFESYLSPA
jgi:nitrile hydratase beta subunit